MKISNVKRWLNKNNIDFKVWAMMDGSTAICAELPSITTEEYSTIKSKLIKHLNKYNGIYEFRAGYSCILIKNLITE